MVDFDLLLVLVDVGVEEMAAKSALAGRFRGNQWYRSNGRDSKIPMSSLVCWIG